MAKINNAWLRKLVNNFDEAAQSYGYESDQGSEESAEESLNNYQRCKQKLINYLNTKIS